jgi:anthranilate synthase/aminodeoxychorismate synthase-like glutamine amidotransferase
MKILVLDNYDSFTWNLVQALESAAADTTCLVYRSDRVTLSDVAALATDRIILSPGPFGPGQAGICPEVVEAFAGRIPILGVCLGMQVIAAAAGAKVVPSGRPMHGKASPIHHDDRGLLHGLPNPFTAGRYHSLVIDPDSIPPGLEISASSGTGEIMGCRLRGFPVEGVLFHPESFLTEHGARIFTNFLSGVPAHVV